jgi:hypothetical protein
MLWILTAAGHLPALLRLFQVFEQLVSILAQFTSFGKHGG